MFNTAEELKGVLKEKYQHEYEEFMVQEAKKVFIILLIMSQLLSVNSPFYSSRRHIELVTAQAQ